MTYNVSSGTWNFYSLTCCLSVSECRYFKPADSPVWGHVLGDRLSLLAVDAAEVKVVAGVKVVGVEVADVLHRRTAMLMMMMMLKWYHWDTVVTFLIAQAQSLYLALQYGWTAQLLPTVWVIKCFMSNIVKPCATELVLSEGILVYVMEFLFLLASHISALAGWIFVILVIFNWILLQFLDSIQTSDRSAL